MANISRHTEVKTETGADAEDTIGMKYLNGWDGQKAAEVSVSLKLFCHRIFYLFKMA